MKILWQFLMKKRNIESWKKALESRTVKEVSEKKFLIEEGKKIGINEVIKRNEIINKFKIKGYDNSWKGKMERLW